MSTDFFSYVFVGFFCLFVYLFLIQTLFFGIILHSEKTSLLQSCISEPLIPQLCPWCPAPYTAEMWICDVCSESGHILGCKPCHLKEKPLCCHCKPQQCPWEGQHLANAQVLELFTIHAPCDATHRYGASHYLFQFFGTLDCFSSKIWVSLNSKWD